MESAAQRAAAVWAIGQELLTQVPIPQHKMNDEWFGAWAKGDTNVDYEVQSVLLDKSASFDCKVSIPTLKRLVSEQVFARPVTAAPMLDKQLQLDKFALLMKQLQHDEIVFQKWLRKLEDVKTSHEHAEHVWKLTRRQKCEGAADWFLESCCKLIVWDKTKSELNVAEVLNFKRDKICLKLSCSTADAPAILWLNHAAPAVIPKEIAHMQIGLLHWQLTEVMTSVALCLLPVFTHQKGRLHLEERMLIEMLAAGHVNLDWLFALQFSAKSDQRDMRPMFYHGRFIFSSPLDLSKNPFWNCDLRRAQRTPEIPQLAAKHMREVESLAADALPTSTSTEYISHASKYFQIGQQACENVLTSVLTNAAADTLGPAVLVIDMLVRNGDMLLAFTKERSNRNNLFYLGFCTDQDELMFCEQVVKDQLVESYESGTALPNGDRLETKVNPDLLDPLPPKPNLNVLAACHCEFGPFCTMIVLFFSNCWASFFMFETIHSPYCAMSGDQR